MLQFQNSLADHDSGTQFRRIHWFRQIIIGSGCHRKQEILLPALGREHYDVGVGCSRSVGSYMAADLDAIETGQHPIEQNQIWRFGTFQYRDRFSATCDSDKIEPPLA